MDGERGEGDGELVQSITFFIFPVKEWDENRMCDMT